MSAPVRVLFVCSSGGHLDQLLALLPQPGGVDIAIATFLKPDAASKIAGMRSYGLYWPTNRSIKALFINLKRALSVLRRERPAIIVSSGAAAAVPFFFAGKMLFRTKNVFVECFDRVDNATMTARLTKPVTDLYVCQWDTQLADYRHREQVTRSR